MGLELGDALTVNVLGRDIEATVASFREVDFFAPVPEPSGALLAGAATLGLTARRRPTRCTFSVICSKPGSAMMTLNHYTLKSLRR